MMHNNRRFHIKNIETAVELAEQLTGAYAWTLCTGFELHGLLFLNDSFTEDSLQEYAVIRAGRQVESVTFSWCDQATAENHIYDVLNGEEVDLGPVEPRLDYESHLCQFCR